MNSKTILIIAAVLLLISSRTVEVDAQSSARTFNERHVIRSLRLLHGAQATYQATVGAGNYGSFQDLRQAGFIDEALASGSKYGFVFAMSTTTGPATLRINATPARYRKTGIRSFFIDSGGELRGGDRQGQPASSSDPIIDDCTSGTIVENERCTIQDLRIVASAQTTYAATLGNGNYGLFPQLYAAGLLRAGLADYSSRGYNYVVQVIDREPGVNEASYKIWAVPHVYGATGVRSFYVDTTAVLRGADKNGGNADQNDPPINE